jgi:hypothetical protein
VLSSCSVVSGTQASCLNLAHRCLDVWHGYPPLPVYVRKDGLGCGSSGCYINLSTFSILTSYLAHSFVFPYHPIRYVIHHFPAICSLSLAFFTFTFSLFCYPFSYLICCPDMVMRGVEHVHFTPSYLLYVPLFCYDIYSSFGRISIDLCRPSMNILLYS